MFAIITISIYLHHHARPYAEEKLNQLETVGLVSISFLLFAALFFIEGEQILRCVQ